MPGSTAAERRETIELLRDILHGLLRASAGAWAELDLTLPQLRAVFAVAHGDRPGVARVAEALGVGKATASHLVDKAVRAGLVRRYEDETDRRARPLGLTEAGEELIGRLLGWELLATRGLKRLAGAELAALNGALARLAAALGTGKAGAGPARGGARARAEA